MSPTLNFPALVVEAVAWGLSSDHGKLLVNKGDYGLWFMVYGLVVNMVYGVLVNMVNMVNMVYGDIDESIWFMEFWSSMDIC